MVHAVEHAWDKSKKEIRWPTKLDRDDIVTCLESFLPIDPFRRRQLSVWLAFWALTQTSPELQAIHQSIHSLIRDKHVKWIRLLGHSPKDARRIADASNATAFSFTRFLTKNIGRRNTSR